MSLLGTLRFASRTARYAAIARKPALAARLQERRLRRLLQIAARRSPHYARKYAGIDVARAPLSELPVTTKDELMLNFDEVVTDHRIGRAAIEEFIGDPANLGRWFLGEYAVSHTSGSQGRPLLIVQDRGAIEVLFALMSSRANTTGRPGPIEGLRRLRRPARLAIVAHRRGFYPSAAAFEFMQQIVGRFVELEWLSALQPDLVEELNRFQPTVLVGYASVLEALALQADELRLPGLRQIGNSSEQLTPRARARVETAFGVPVMDHYGTGECLVLADGCATHGGAHINADWAIVEVVDENYEPVERGATGAKILVTNLANRVQPFIRYEVADRVVMATEPCGCGNRLPRIARIEGRAAELFWILERGRRRMVTGVLFHTAADSLHEIREWQAKQLDAKTIEVRLELLPTALSERESIGARYVARLREQGLPEGVEVLTRVVDRIAGDASTGKLKRMIPREEPSAAELAVTIA